MSKHLFSLVLALLIAVGYVYWSQAKINALRRSEALSRQNLTALSDTLRLVRHENGEIESSRLALVSERDKLHDLNSSLASRVDRLRGELSVALAATAAATSHDTVFVPVTDEIRTDSSRIWQWTYDPALPPGNRLLVRGRSGVVHDSAFTKVTSHQIAIDMAFGVRKRSDGLYEVVGQSTWPGLVLNVEGAILEPDWIVRKKRSRLIPFAIGFGLGVILWEVAR